MALHIDPERALSPSRQVVEAVLDWVASGRLGPGDRLPSVRDAAAEALVNPNTIARAWRDLEALGVVAGRAGLGVFVTPGGPEVARTQRRDATLEALRRALHEALRSGHEPEALRRETEDAIGRAGAEGAPAKADAKGGRT